MTTEQAKLLAPTMVLTPKNHTYPKQLLTSTYHEIDLTEIEKLLIKDFKYIIRENTLIIQFYNENIPTQCIKLPLHRNHKPMHIIQSLIASGCTLMD